MFKLKPNGYKTPIQWMTEGKIAIDPACLETCVVVSKYGNPVIRNGSQITCNYVSPENVRDATQQEQEDFWKVHKKPSSVKLANPSKKEKVVVEATPPVSSNNVIIFDTETTGFSNKDELLQLSIYDRNGKVILDTYVKPINHSYWGAAMAVNHITPQMVKEAPTVNELLFTVKDIFENADVIVGHNVSFDARMIANSFDIEIPKEKLYDTLSVFKKQKEGGPYKLEDAVKFYCSDKLDEFVLGAHSSSVDTLATVAVFNAQQDIIREKYNSQSNIIEIEQLELDL